MLACRIVASLPSSRSKFVRRSQPLNQLIRASFDNVQAAKEIAAACAQLQRKSYNVSIATVRHRAAAQTFAPIAAEIIRVTRSLHGVVGLFVDHNQSVIDQLVRYARRLRMVRLLAEGVIEVFHQQQDQIPLRPDDAFQLSLDFDPAFYATACRGEELKRSPRVFGAAVNALAQLNRSLNDEVRELHQRYRVLQGTNDLLGQLLGSGRYATDLGSLEARKLLDVLRGLALTADELCAILSGAQERRAQINQRLIDIPRMLPLLKD